MQSTKRAKTRVTPLQIAPLVAALALAACTQRTSTASIVTDDVATTSTAEAPPRDGRVILITIDGARWQDVFEGSDPKFSGAPSVPPEQLMPRAHALAATRGVAIGATRAGCGTVHTAGRSNVSLPGYLEIFTGHASHCLDNACAQVEETVFDEAARDAQVSVASIGSWEMLSRAVSSGASGVMTSVGRDWPEAVPVTGHLAELVDAGRKANPYPGIDAYRPDGATAAIALEYLRVNKPALFHIGLGDTDELGHRSDYGGYLAALEQADDMIGAVADILDTMDEDGAKTTVIVTPDHGRNSDFRDHGVFRPESGRTFVLAFGRRVAAQGIACPSHDYTLADIAPTIRVLMGLPKDRADGAGRAIDLITEAPK
jgi:hypothetical protein